MDKQEIARNIKLALWDVGINAKSITINKNQVSIKGEICQEVIDLESKSEPQTKEAFVDSIS